MVHLGRQQLTDASQAVEVVHVGRQGRQHGRGYVGMAGCEPTGQPLLPLDDRQPVGVQPQQPGRQAVVLA